MALKLELGDEAAAERVGAKVEVPLRSRMVRLCESLRWEERITDLRCWKKRDILLTRGSKCSKCLQTITRLIT
jgi:hypothetical protein